MADKDCFIFVDPDPNIPEEARCMSFLCVKCKREHYPDTEMHFHPGSSEGYGPFDYKCCKCSFLLHENKQEEIDVEEK